MIQNQPHCSERRWNLSKVSLIGSLPHDHSGGSARETAFRMDLTLESRDGVLLATVTGRVSFSEALECWKKICDAAAERGCGKILFDALGAEGEISDLEKYEVSKII